MHVGKMQVDDEFLYRYMPGLEEKIMKAYPEEGEFIHEFSESFEKRMEKLLARMRQKERYGIPIRTGARIAAAIALILAGSIAVSVNTDALGMEWIKEKLYEYTQVIHKKETEKRYYAPEEKVGEFVPLYPAYIPKGYELTVEDRGDTYLFLSYENPENTGFIIDQEQVKDGMVVGEDNEYVREEKAQILGYDGKICYKEDGTVHIWWESENTLYLAGANSFGKEELLKICESLRPKEK
jgi:hypothetical protein